MQKQTIKTLWDMKASGDKFTCLTAYDATFSHLISTMGVEGILVGDSLGMVMQGKESTVPVSMDDMVYHTRCVAKGNQGALLISDMPFMSYSNEDQSLKNAAKLMQAGAQVVKLEGGSWLCSTVKKLSERGIPTCLHLGLTPQSVSMLGGYKTQGRDLKAAKQMIADVELLTEAGASFFVLECVPRQLAREIAGVTEVPVIGIGAGMDVDAQILVIQDMLGLTYGRVPKFVKNFMSEAGTPQAAVVEYVRAVKSGLFPDYTQSFD